MMLQGIRRTLRPSTLLALLLLGFWVGVGLVHEHTGAPTCQVCHALHSSADLVSPIGVEEPVAVTLLPAPPALPSAAVPHPPTPPGRAPPLA